LRKLIQKISESLASGGKSGPVTISAINDGPSKEDFDKLAAEVAALSALMDKSLKYLNTELETKASLQDLANL
jgi:hypothetical protein